MSVLAPSPLPEAGQTAADSLVLLFRSNFQMVTQEPSLGLTLKIRFCNFMFLVKYADSFNNLVEPWDFRNPAPTP